MISIYTFVEQVHNITSDLQGMRKAAFASHDVKRGEVVVNYIGKLIFLSEAAKRESRVCNTR